MSIARHIISLLTSQLMFYVAKDDSYLLPVKLSPTEIGNISDCGSANFLQFQFSPVATISLSHIILISFIPNGCCWPEINKLQEQTNNHKDQFITEIQIERIVTTCSDFKCTI